MQPSRQAFVGAGANLGDRFATLCRAVARLRHTDGMLHAESSAAFESEPVGLAEQPRFLNLAIGIETTLSPEELLLRLQAIELEFGRTREIHWGPRTLDLDLLAYEGERRSTPTLELPHPRMLERAFVTVPVSELLKRPRFRSHAWDELRADLARTSLGEKSVWEWEPGLDAPDVCADALDFLRGLKQQGIQPGLERMRAFAAELGAPQDRIPVIHVAGTNGKGSVAAMLESILRKAGWRTGLYTSPHLIRFGERIQVNRQPLGFRDLLRHVAELRTASDRLINRSGPQNRPSYFEFMTSIAFTHFARSGCDVAIVEVGMGGLLDATNVVKPQLSVITSIGHDHAEFLGDSLEQIATHKAGIIKPGTTVVMGRLPEAAEQVVRTTAVRQGAELRSVIERFGNDVGAYPQTKLDGDYQRLNAATATLAAEALPARWRITPQAIRSGLDTVNWPGRWQRLVVGGRTVVVDTSHNEEGAAALAANLSALSTESKQKPVVITGVLGAARAKPLLDVICRYAREIHLVVPRQQRACSTDELASMIPATFAGRVHSSSVERVFPSPGICLPDEPIAVPVVVTGSIYLAGEVLARTNPSLGPVENELQDF